MRRLVAPATVVLTAAALAALTLFAAPALAAGSLTFDGQCQFTGISSFSSPVTLVPSLVRNNVAASGTCSGSLARQSGATTQLNDAPVQYQATEVGAQESCVADPNASGKGRLIFQDGSLRFQVIENRVSGQAVLGYTGRSGGSATGVAYVNSSDPAGLLEQCAAVGITSASVSIVFQTTPAIGG